MKYVKNLALGLGVLLSFASAEQAMASPTTDIGYVCNVSLNPPNNPATPGTGNSGFITVRMSAGPKCTGAFFNQFRIYSQGATLGKVAFHYSEPALISLYDTLYQAQRTGEQVLAVGDDGIGSGQVAYYNTVAFQPAL
jgi:hypothetical protein